MLRGACPERVEALSVTSMPTRGFLRPVRTSPDLPAPCLPFDPYSAFRRSLASGSRFAAAGGSEGRFRSKPARRVRLTGTRLRRTDRPAAPQGRGPVRHSGIDTPGELMKNSHDNRGQGHVECVRHCYLSVPGPILDRSACATARQLGPGHTTLSFHRRNEAPAGQPNRAFPAAFARMKAPAAGEPGSAAGRPRTS